jgi:hypothetical protein
VGGERGGASGRRSKLRGESVGEKGASWREGKGDFLIKLEEMMRLLAYVRKKYYFCRQIRKLI